MISVVIPAFNEEKNIAHCLASLTKQTTKEPFEVIVVDNASTDKTAEIAKKFSHELNVKVILEKYKGRGAARRAGFAVAKGDIIFSTDADTTVPPNWIDSLAPFFRDPQVVGVTGIGRVKEMSFFQMVFINVGQPILTRMYRLISGYYWLAGFNSAYRRTAYLQAGGFNKDLNAFEDAEIADRIRKYGCIKLTTKIPVMMSGRRFKKSTSSGTWQYLQSYFAYQFTRDKTYAYLTDVRD